MSAPDALARTAELHVGDGVPLARPSSRPSRPGTPPPLPVSSAPPPLPASSAQPSLTALSPRGVTVASVHGHAHAHVAPSPPPPAYVASPPSPPAHHVAPPPVGEPLHAPEPVTYVAASFGASPPPGPRPSMPLLPDAPPASYGFFPHRKPMSTPQAFVPASSPDFAPSQSHDGIAVESGAHLTYQVYAPDALPRPRRSVSEIPPKKPLGSVALGLRVCLVLLGLCLVVGTASAVVAVSDDAPSARSRLAAEPRAAGALLGEMALGDVPVDAIPSAANTMLQDAPSVAEPAVAVAPAVASEEPLALAKKKKKKRSAATSDGPQAARADGAVLVRTLDGAQAGAKGSADANGARSARAVPAGAPPPNPYAGLPTVSAHPKGVKKKKK